MLARLEDDPREDDRLTGLELHAARERRPLAQRDVLGDPLAILERTVLAPDLSGLLRDAPVGFQLLLGNRHDESIDVLHVAISSHWFPPSSIGPAAFRQVPRGIRCNV